LTGVNCASRPPVCAATMPVDLCVIPIARENYIIDQCAASPWRGSNEHAWFRFRAHGLAISGNRNWNLDPGICKSGPAAARDGAPHCRGSRCRPISFASLPRFPRPGSPHEAWPEALKSVFRSYGRDCACAGSCRRARARQGLGRLRHFRDGCRGKSGRPSSGVPLRRIALSLRLLDGHQRG
jgi:hypothetical protein